MGTKTNNEKKLNFWLQTIWLKVLLMKILKKNFKKKAMKSKFKIKFIDFLKSLLFWRGRKKGMIHTMDIKFDDIRAVFFPVNFHEKYRYLGSVPYDEKGSLFEALEPLVIFMDYKAKPWWCQRWVLRFLHLFGNDNSIIRVRNRTLYNLHRWLTKGIMLWDYKTKWEWYDLRISVSGNRQVEDLADSIEAYYCNQGYRKSLADQIKKLDTNTKYHKGYLQADLKKELGRLRSQNSTSNEVD